MRRPGPVAGTGAPRWPNRDVRDLDRVLRRRGWESVQLGGGRHLQWRWPPTGEVLTVSTTASDWRARSNTLALARRIEKGTP